MDSDNDFDEYAEDESIEYELVIAGEEQCEICNQPATCIFVDHRYCTDCYDSEILHN